MKQLITFISQNLNESPTCPSQITDILVSLNCYYFVGIFVYLYWFYLKLLLRFIIICDLISVTTSYIHINIWLFAICLNCNKHFIEPNIIVAIFWQWLRRFHNGNKPIFNIEYKLIFILFIKMGFWITKEHWVIIRGAYLIQ